MIEVSAAVQERLRDDGIAWLVTVDPTGAPNAIPVWFLWDGEEVLLYSEPRTAKLRSIDLNDKVALHLDSDGSGGAIVVVRGRARRSGDPPAHEVPEFVEKYGWGFRRHDWAPADFGERYSVPVRIAPQALVAW